MHLACPGTPIIDAHFNLNVQPAANDPERGMTVFTQYKHSINLDTDEKVKVSMMNDAAAKLKKRLTKHSWPSDRQWVFLWVTNRSVTMDVEPHEKLLWVGRQELSEHAPLIAMRGLVAVEENRNDK